MRAHLEFICLKSLLPVLNFHMKDSTTYKNKKTNKNFLNHGNSFIMLPVCQRCSAAGTYFFIYRCGAGIGMALWILESYVVLLDASDIRNVKGCTVPPPYLDDYGETDPGLRYLCM